MSCVFVVAPIIVGGFPAFAGLAAVAAAAMSLSALKSDPKLSTQTELSQTTTVDLDVKNIESVAGGLRADDRISFGDGRITITVAKDPRGKCSVHVEGNGISKSELKELGKNFLARIMQQYAYQKVQTELETQGFTVVQEKVETDLSIRIKFRKSG